MVSASNFPKRSGGPGGRAPSAETVEYRDLFSSMPLDKVAVFTFDTIEAAKKASHRITTSMMNICKASGFKLSFRIITDDSKAKLFVMKKPVVDKPVVDQS